MNQGTPSSLKIILAAAVIFYSGTSSSLKAYETVRNCINRCIIIRCPDKKYRNACEKQHKAGCKRDCTRK